jgi:monoamine oxidase
MRARTALARQVQDLTLAVGPADGSTTMGRRQFLAAAGGVAAVTATGLHRRYRHHASGTASPARVIVVGAGVAGLTCAYRLQQQGIVSTVLEASDRVGGRTRTLRGFFAAGQISEEGGEFIDTDHRRTRALAAELGLVLDNLPAGTPGNLKSNDFFFNGATYPYRHAQEAFQQLYPALHQDFLTCKALRYDNHPPGAVRLDQMSIAEWIDRRVPDGARSRFGALLTEAYTGEDAVATDQASAVNIISQLGQSPEKSLHLYGKEDDSYRIRGGNDQIATRLANRLGPGVVRLDSPLVAIRRHGREVVCSIANGAAVRDVAADHVVLALPFTTLRRTDFSGAGFSAAKRACIDELGMGTNSKLVLQFDERVWRIQGRDGYTESDLGTGSTWEQSVDQPGSQGLLALFTGGLASAAYGDVPAHAPASDQLRRHTAQVLDRLFPGISGYDNGLAYLNHWAADPYCYGSYSAYLIGQFSRFEGLEGLAEGPVHFCGEQCSDRFQGYIEGAVETGEHAATEVAQALGSGSPL